MKARSQLWKHMLHNKDISEKFLWWKPKRGAFSVCYGLNLILYINTKTKVYTCHPKIDIKEFMQKITWDYKRMKYHLPNHIIDHVMLYLNLVKQTNEGDKPWWLKTSNGLFFVEGVQKVLRKREEVNDSFQNI